MNDPVLSGVFEIVAVAVSQEVPGGGDAVTRWNGAAPAACARLELLLANRCLVIGHPQVFGPEFRSHANRHSGCSRDGDVMFVSALGVDVEIDFSAGIFDRLEERFLEIVSTVGNSTLRVNAETQAGYSGTCFENSRQTVPAVCGVSCGSES